VPVPVPVPVVVVDPNPLFWARVVWMFSELAGERFRVLVGCSSLDDLSDKIVERCKLVLLSIDDAVEPTLADVQALAERGIRVVVLSDRMETSAILAATAAGLRGYLVKTEISPDALIASLEIIMLGGFVIPRALSGLLGQMPESALAGKTIVDVPIAPGWLNQPEDDDQPPLSDRERMILHQLKRGASNKQIARELGIAAGTVKVHVKSVLRKIRVQNRTQAAVWAMQNLNSASALVSSCE
jgi:two-component system, NarL family, nitrate/nitrite response regulator NarL